MKPPSAALQRKRTKLLMSDGLQHYRRRTEHEREFWAGYQLMNDQTQFQEGHYDVALPGDLLPVGVGGSGYAGRTEDVMIAILDRLSEDVAKVSRGCPFNPEAKRQYLEWATACMFGEFLKREDDEQDRVVGD